MIFLNRRMESGQFKTEENIFLICLLIENNAASRVRTDAGIGFQDQRLNHGIRPCSAVQKYAKIDQQLIIIYFGGNRFTNIRQQLKQSLNKKYLNKKDVRRSESRYIRYE